MHSEPAPGDRNFLFVAGCARSGTTALTNLLNQHADLAISIERFNRITEPRAFSLTPNHFTSEHFFQPTLAETHYTDFDAKHPKVGGALRDRFATARYIGDKKPRFYQVYEQLFAAFDGMRVVFIYRDPVDVASSYEGRRRKGNNWSESMDHRRAIQDWNASLQATADISARHPGQVLVVDYETVFLSDESLDPIWEFLELDPAGLDDTTVAVLRAKSARLAQQRERLLNDEQLAYVHSAMDLRLRAAMQNLNPLLEDVDPEVLARLPAPLAPTRSFRQRVRGLLRR